MTRLPLIFALFAVSFAAAGLQAARQPAVAATVILIEGEPVYFENGVRHKIDLGQAIGSDAVLELPKGASLHLILANGSSLILTPGCRVEFKAPELPPARPHYLVTLTAGRLGVMIDERDGPLNLELFTAEAVVECKRGHFELATTGGESRVTVDSGNLLFGAVDRDKRVEVAGTHSAVLFDKRLSQPARLGKRDAGEFRRRWQRSEMIHGQRRQLLKNLRSLR